MIKTIVAFDDNSMNLYPEWSILEVDDSKVDPVDVAAACLGFATDIPYRDYFTKYGVKYIDGNDNYTDGELDDIYDEIEDITDGIIDPEDLIHFVYGDVDAWYYLSELANSY